MTDMPELSFLRLREAVEAAWRPDTAYLEVSEEGNPALGNCYPTARVVQIFFPEMEIVEGEVWTGRAVEKHFWNAFTKDGVQYHVDWTWQQFPQGSIVRSFKVRDRATLGDGEQTLARVALLERRVRDYLNI